MELQYKQQPLHNNFMDASYAAGGLQGHTWEFQWGPQGLELAIKRIGMSPVITQNFSTDPMGRPLSMTYQGPTYSGELYFHYDVQGNTSLLTDSNGNGVASFRYDLHNGQIAESWNPANLEIVNLKGGRQGSVTLTSANGYLPDWGMDLTVQPWKPIIARNDWGFINIRHDSTEPGDEDDKDDEKDCGEDPCEIYEDDDCETLNKTLQKIINQNCRVIIHFENPEHVCKMIDDCVTNIWNLLYDKHRGCLEENWKRTFKCWFIPNNVKSLRGQGRDNAYNLMMSLYKSKSDSRISFIFGC